MKLVSKIKSKLHRTPTAPPAPKLRLVDEVVPGNINFFADGTYSSIDGDLERKSHTTLVVVVDNEEPAADEAPESNLGDRLGRTFVSHTAARAVRAVHRGFTRVGRGIVRGMKAVGRFLLAIPIAIITAIAALFISFVVVVRGKQAVRDFILDDHISDDLRPAA